MLRLKKIRLFLALAIVVAGAALVATVMLNFEQTAPKVKPLSSLPENVDMALKKVHYSEVKDGVKEWDLYAEQAVYDKNSQVFHLSKVKLIVAAQAATGDISLTADRASYDTKTKDVKLLGQVKAKTASGMYFTTDSAAYIFEDSVITTADPISFSDSRFQLRGVGMELHTVTRDIKIMKAVTADIMGGSNK